MYTYMHFLFADRVCGDYLLAGAEQRSRAHSRRYRRVFLRPWIPVHLRSDNGSEFANQQIRTCTNKLG